MVYLFIVIFFYRFDYIVVEILFLNYIFDYFLFCVNLYFLRIEVKREIKVWFSW